MRNKIFSLFLVLLLPLAACNSLPTPQNVREAYVASEFQFQAIVVTVTDLAQSGVLQPGTPQAITIVEALNESRVALDVWRAALDNPDAQTRAMQSIRLAQAVLQSIQENLGDPA